MTTNNRKNGVALARDAALVALEAAMKHDAALLEAVTSAVKMEQFAALQGLTQLRLALHTTAVDAVTTLRKLGTAQLADPVRGAIARGDVDVLVGAMFETPGRDTDVEIVGMQTTRDVCEKHFATKVGFYDVIARESVDAIVAAAWPGILKAHRLPAETLVPPGIAEAVVQRRIYVTLTEELLAICPELVALKVPCADGMRPAVVGSTGLPRVLPKLLTQEDRRKRDVAPYVEAARPF